MSTSRGKRTYPHPHQPEAGLDGQVPILIRLGAAGHVATSPGLDDGSSSAWRSHHETRPHVFPRRLSMNCSYLCLRLRNLAEPQWHLAIPLPKLLP
jgi:hypothetical protein